MPTDEMDPDRVTEIVNPATGEVGSGYLVAPRLVLTARHVVVGKSAAPGGASQANDGQGMRDPYDPALVLKVRFHGDVHRKVTENRWRFKCVWDRRALDLALLACDDPEGTFKGMAPAGAAPTLFSDLAKGEELTGRAMGYPRYRDSGKKRDSARVTCAIDEVSARIGDIVPLTFTLNPGVTEPEDWRGFSGAPTFRGAQLVGVVTQVDPNLDPPQLKMRPIRDIKDDDASYAAFCGILPDPAWHGAAAPAAPAAAPRFAPDPLLRCVYLFDRANQVAHIRGAAGSLHVVDALPVFCLIGGEPQHRSELLMQRFRKGVAQTWPPAGTPGYNRTITIDLGDQVGDPDLALLLARQRLASKLRIDGDGEAASVAAAFRQGTASRFVEFIVSEKIWGDRGAALVESWAAYWSQVGQHGVGRPVLVLTYLDLDGPASAKLRALCEPAAPARGAHLRHADPRSLQLKHCRLSDFEDWKEAIEAEAPLHAPTIADIEELGALLEQWSARDPSYKSFTVSQLERWIATPPPRPS